MGRYCKRLIEVDLPIRRISELARREKNLRKGHPWHLHIWWARRPWGACRVIALASLLPAPVDDKCSKSFIESAYKILCPIIKPADRSRKSVHTALLKFVGEFAAWELGGNFIYLNAARELIKATYTNAAPLVLDSFAGYGAIPGESARLGCESFGGELNPVALLCMTILLNSIPKQGNVLIEKVREGTTFVINEAKKRLLNYYPLNDGRHVAAWLWARTIKCEGPNCVQLSLLYLKQY